MSNLTINFMHQVNTLPGVSSTAAAAAKPSIDAGAASPLGSVPNVPQGDQFLASNPLVSGGTPPTDSPTLAQTGGVGAGETETDACCDKKKDDKKKADKQEQGANGTIFDIIAKVLQLLLAVMGNNEPKSNQAQDSAKQAIDPNKNTMPAAAPALSV